MYQGYLMPYREEGMFPFVSKCEKLLILFYILSIHVRTLTYNCFKQHKLYQGCTAVMFNTVESFLLLVRENVIFLSHS